MDIFRLQSSDMIISVYGINDYRHMIFLMLEEAHHTNRATKSHPYSNAHELESIGLLPVRSSSTAWLATEDGKQSRSLVYEPGVCLPVCML